MNGQLAACSIAEARQHIATIGLPVTVLLGPPSRRHSRSMMIHNAESLRGFNFLEAFKSVPRGADGMRVLCIKRLSLT